MARFNPADFAAKVSVSDADLEAYYKEHTAQFQVPEQASIEYLVLDLEAAKKNIAVNEAELRTYYDQNTARFGTKEERRASHILITAPAERTCRGAREGARQGASNCWREVKKAPNTFADVARKNSQDPGSAEKGGDLDFVTRGAMVKPFEDAMFALKKGEISDVVETEFGYHIIQLDDIKPGVVPPFEQVRATIENEVRSAAGHAGVRQGGRDLHRYRLPAARQPEAGGRQAQAHDPTATKVGRTPAPGATGALASRNFLERAVRRRFAGAQAQHRGDRGRAAASSPRAA